MHTHVRGRDAEVRGAPLRKGLHLALVVGLFPGLPVSYVLILKSHGAETKQISRMDQFRGLMDVRSASDAVNVLRLNSYLEGDSIIAVLPNPNRRMMEILTPDQYRAKNRQLTAPYQMDWWKERSDGFAGMVVDKGLQTKASRYPISGRDREGFRVTRLVAVETVIFGDNTGNLPCAEEITEHVGFDGSYRIVSERKVPDKRLQKVQWFFPMKM
jgi:hypothetical protein